jgi:hypothetical protein
MFKKLVAMIVAIETREDFDTVWSAIDIAFQHEKISLKEFMLLTDLVKKIGIEDQ